MGTCVLKASPEINLFGEWSTVVDGFVSIGTRADMIAKGIAPDRLDRAHQTGTSALDYPLGGYHATGLLVLDGGACSGFLPRQRLAAYMLLLDESEDEAARRLLDPLDESEDET